MKSNKARALLGLGLATAVGASLIGIAGIAARTPKQVGPWKVSTRSAFDWFRPYHGYHVLTQPNGTKSVLETKSSFMFALSRPLRGPKADQMIANYEQLPKKPGTYYSIVQEPRW